MIYPTRRAILIAAAGAPIALLAGLAFPGGWATAGAWIVVVLGLALTDALIGPGRADAALDLVAPAALGIGGEGEARVSVHFPRGRPRNLTLALETNDRLAAWPERLALVGGEGVARLIPQRRGLGQIDALWLRWPGPLGLVWKQVRAPVRRAVPVTPNIEAIKAEAVRLFSRQALAGLKTQLDTGDGTDFHALRELTGPMDTRAIDWKQSARHLKLLGKEFRAEANHPIVFAIDGGRQMCEPAGRAPQKWEPVLRPERAQTPDSGSRWDGSGDSAQYDRAPVGVPRVDLALNAALLTAFVCLKLGDRAALFGFDARPRLYTGFVSGAAAFERLRRASSGIDYGTEETNYTLGLTELAACLRRRSLVVVFTEFTDATTAELMTENITRLVRRHLVLFVVFRDEELEGLAAREPTTPEDVTRAVTAAALLRSREVVIERLRRLGVHIVEAPPGRMGPAVLDAYLDLKRRELL